MMNKIKLIVAVATGLLLPMLALAGLTVTIDNGGSFTGTPGSSVLVTGTVTNPTQGTVYLNGFYGVPTISGNPASIGIDLMATNNYLPSSLSAGQNYQGPLVKVVIATSTAAGVYTGTYDPAGGTAPTSLTELGPKTFSVTVSGAGAGTSTSTASTTGASGLTGGNSTSSTTIPNAPLTGSVSGSTSTLSTTGGLQIPAEWQSATGGNGGSTGQYAAGPRLIKQDGDSTVYWVSPSNLKVPMLSSAVFLSYHNKWSDVQSVGQDEFNYYQNAKFIRLNGSGAIYKISTDGTKRQISVQAWAEAGLDASVIISVNKTDFNSYQNGSGITDSAEVLN